MYDVRRSAPGSDLGASYSGHEGHLAIGSRRGFVTGRESSEYRHKIFGDLPINGDDPIFAYHPCTADLGAKWSALASP